MDRDTPVRVAFVGGHGRSGSTLLSRILGALPGFWTVGELCYLWDQGVRNDRMCGCGAQFHDCPFWTAVGEKAFGGWDRELAAEAVRLRKSVERVRYVPLMAAGGVPPRYQARLHRYAELMSQVYAAVREVAGADVLVDTSKYPSSAYLLRRVPGVELRLVHLVRSSHGVCYSWTKRVERPDRDGKPLAQYPPVRTAVEWDVFNGLLAALGRLGVPSRLVRYEDLIGSPRSVVSETAEFLHRRPDSAALSFLRDDAVELPGDHSVAGNPMRFTVGEIPLRLDEAWRTRMPRRTRSLITALTMPGLLGFGYLPQRAENGTNVAMRS
ncbi:MAG TPA: sulfotransferase [Streptosporangiales bacterium]